MRDPKAAGLHPFMLTFQATQVVWASNITDAELAASALSGQRKLKCDAPDRLRSLRSAIYSSQAVAARPPGDNDVDPTSEYSASPNDLMVDGPIQWGGPVRLLNVRELGDECEDDDD